MKWQDFTEIDREYPEKIVESVISGFSKATNELAIITISPLEYYEIIGSHLETDFQFDVHLRSKHVKNYMYKVFSFGYNVELAPIYILLEESIYENMYKRRKSPYEKTIVKSENEFRIILEKIFQSPRFVEIVSGVMKLAKKS